MADENVIADPSSAEQAAPKTDPPEIEQPDIETFSPEDRREWLGKGHRLAMPKAADPAPAKDPATTESKPAESTPAPDSSAPGPDEKPGETVAAPEAALKQQGKKGKAEDRVAELLAERHGLRTRIEALEKGAKPAESPAAEKPKPLDKPVRPKIGDVADETWEQYEARVEKWETDREAWLISETEKATEKKITARNQEADNKKAWDAAAQEHGADFPALMDTVRAGSTPELQSALSSLDNWSGVAVHLARNPEKLAGIAAKFKANPVAAIADLGRLEAVIAEAAKPPESPPVGPKPHTKAPPPPTDLAARNAAPADARRAAVEADNFEAYVALENAREHKQRA